MDRLKEYIKSALMVIGFLIGAFVAYSGTQDIVKLIFHKDLNIDLPWLEGSISGICSLAAMLYWANLLDKIRGLNILIYELDQYLQIIHQLSFEKKIEKDSLKSIILSSMKSKVERIVELKKRSL